MKSVLFATRFIASSTLYYSCSANHSKQDMKSNHTDNAMEEQAPTPSLTLSLMLEVSGSISVPPFCCIRGLVSVLTEPGLGFLIHLISKLSGEVALTSRATRGHSPQRTLNRQSQASCPAGTSWCCSGLSRMPAQEMVLSFVVVCTTKAWIWP